MIPDSLMGVFPYNLLPRRAPKRAAGLQLLRRVQAGFVLQGTSLRAWCIRHKVSPTLARSALLGAWDGPRGRQMRARVVQAAQIDQVAA